MEAPGREMETAMRETAEFDLTWWGPGNIHSGRSRGRAFWDGREESEVGLELGMMFNRKMGLRPESSDGAGQHCTPGPW